MVIKNLMTNPAPQSGIISLKIKEAMHTGSNGSTELTLAYSTSIC